jgi:hypothetical protein
MYEYNSSFRAVTYGNTLLQDKIKCVLTNIIRYIGSLHTWLRLSNYRDPQPHVIFFVFFSRSYLSIIYEYVDAIGRIKQTTSLF